MSRPESTPPAAAPTADAVAAALAVLLRWNAHPELEALRR
jgi:hypothetical protein